MNEDRKIKIYKRLMSLLKRILPKDLLVKTQMQQTHTRSYNTRNGLISPSKWKIIFTPSFIKELKKFVPLSRGCSVFFCIEGKEDA